MCYSFHLLKSHQQVLVSSWVLMVSTAWSRGVPEGEGGRWKNLKILKFKIAETNRTG